MEPSHHSEGGSKVKEECKSKVRQFATSWACVVMLSAFSGFSLAAGVFYSFNIFYVEFLNEFKESRSYTAWIGSLFGAMFQIAGPCSSWIIRNFGCRSSVLLGGGGAAIGFAISSFADSVMFLILSFGLFSGTALNFAYSGLTVALGLYCHSYYKLVTSLAFSGVGFGIFFFSSLIQFAVDYYGWRGALLICSGINLNICICGFLLFPSEIPHSSLRTPIPVGQSKASSSSDNVVKSKVISLFPCFETCLNHKSKSDINSLAHSDAVFDLKFLCLNLSCALWVMASVTLLVLYKDIAAAKGWGNKFYILLLCSGISDIIGRIFVGIIMTTEKCSVITYSIICLLLCSLSFFLHILAASFETFLAAGLLFSLAYSKQSVLMILTPAVLYGRQRLAASLGILLFWCGWASLIGPPIGGFIMDNTENSSSALLFFGLIVLLASLLMIMVRIQICREEQSKTKAISNRPEDGLRPTPKMYYLIMHITILKVSTLWSS